MKTLKSKLFTGASIRRILLSLFLVTVFSIPSINIAHAATIPATVTLTPSKTTLHVSYEGQTALVKLSGYVKDANGNPISGITVGVLDSQNYNGSNFAESGNTRTNAAGYWEITNAPIFFYATNWVYAIVEYQDSSGLLKSIKSEPVLIFVTKY